VLFEDSCVGMLLIGGNIDLADLIFSSISSNSQLLIHQ
jgi:hypothetical protein